MTGRTHDLAAFTALTAIAVSQPLPPLTLGTVTMAILANMIGGIAPDIDEPTAPLWRNLPIGGVFGRILHVAVGGHRFLLHSLVGMVGMGILLDMLLMFLKPSWPTLNNGVVWWSFMIGYASHLLADSLTKEGVPWLLPIPIKLGFPPIRAWRITTGKFVEVFLIFPGLAVLELWLVHQNYQYLVGMLHGIVK